MKTVEELKGFYDTALVPELRELEGKRREFLRKAGMLDTAIIALTILVLYFVYSGLYARFWDSSSKEVLYYSIVILVYALGLASIVMGVVTKTITSGFRKEFKSRVIRGIVGFANENLRYSPAAPADRDIARQSWLFETRGEEDYVSGKIGDTRVDFFECMFQAGAKRRVRAIKPMTYRGIFFVADFNKDFKGHTVAVPYDMRGLVAYENLGMRGLQKINLEDPEFEGLFEVYGNNQVEARYILSTSLMKRLIDLAKRLKRPVFMAFSGSRMFLAIPIEKDLFEPSLFSTLLDFEQVKSYFDDLQFTVGIVEDLNLNKRIWGKR